MPSAEELADELKPSSKAVIKDSDWLSSGLSVLDCACSGHTRGAFAKGHYVWFVGDSETGKSQIANQILAEASINKNFDRYRFIYDGSENGDFFDKAAYFGRKVLNRIEPPAGTRAKPKHSETVRQFFSNLGSAIDAGPCIYIEDSFDALDTEADSKKFDQQILGDEKGSFGMAKAKELSQNIKRYVSRLTRNGSILIGISQTREDIGNPFGGKTTAGGKALRFYAHVQLWTTIVKTTKRSVTINGVDNEAIVGSEVKFDIRKNRICGWHGSVKIPYLYKHGFDEIGSCVDYLTKTGQWKESKVKGRNVVLAKGDGFDYELPREKLIHAIESSDEQRELQLLVERVWGEIDDATRVRRKSKYV